MYFDCRQRPLFAALCLSLALHLLVLLGAEWRMPERAAAQDAGSETAASPMQVLVRARALPTAAPAEKSRAEPARVRREAPQPVTTAAAVLPSAAPSPVTVPAPAPSAVPAASSGDMRGGDTAAVEATAGGVSADGLRQYRIDLAGAARRYRSYPALARSRGWEGLAELTVSAGSGGATVRLARSSGYPLLDDQAVDMLTRAVAQTPLPESLRGRSFSFPLPIRFSLEE